MKNRGLDGWLKAFILLVVLAGCRSIEPARPETPVVPKSTAIQAEVQPSVKVKENAPRTAEVAAGSSLFPGVDFLLRATFPQRRNRITLYRLVAEQEPTENSVRALAASLGINGEIYRQSRIQSDLTGQTEFLVTGGTKRLYTLGAQNRIEYQAGNPALFPDYPCEPSCPAPNDNPIRALLNQAGLLDFDYEIVPAPHQANTAAIVQRQDDIRLVYPAGAGPQVDFRTDEKGQPLMIRYQPTRLQTAGERGLLRAEQAWQKLLDGQAGAIYREYAAGPDLPREWLRVYPEGKELNIFGYAQIYRPVSGEGEPLILVNGYPVSGKVRGLAEAAAGGRPVQAWGEAIAGEDGQVILRLSGWQTAVQPETIVEGKITRQGGEAYLISTGGRFMLPDLPGTVPVDLPVTVYGVQAEDGEAVLEWYRLREGPQEAFRSGGPGFLPLDLEDTGNGKTKELPAGPVESLEGVPEVIVHTFSDGSSQVEVQFIPDGKALPLRLDGSGVKGIEPYHRLPVRIWGEVPAIVNGAPAIQVDRFEPVYPGANIQAWLGLIKPGELDGREVFLLTTPQEEQYVIESSLDSAVVPPVGASPPGLNFDDLPIRDPLIVEGILVPDRTVGGYPVIRDLAWSSGIGRNDLEGYTIASDKPRIVNEPGTAGERRRAFVEAIELVYYAPYAAGLSPVMSTASHSRLAVENANLVQPAWMFSGHFEDGAYFEILVQAAEV